MAISSIAGNVSPFILNGVQIDGTKPSKTIDATVVDTFGPAVSIAVPTQAQDSTKPPGDEEASTFVNSGEQLADLFGQLDKILISAGARSLDGKRSPQAVQRSEVSDNSANPFSSQSESLVKELSTIFDQIKDVFNSIRDAKLSLEEEKQLDEINTYRTQIDDLVFALRRNSKRSDIQGSFGFRK